MKKLAATLLAALLICLSCALALSGSGYPAFDGVELPNDAFGASFGDDRLLLTFDPDAEYSNRMNGTLQLSFYAYNADEDHLLELYLELPEDLRAGDGSGLSFAALYLYESDNAAETLYFASQWGGQADPEGTQLKITLERVDVGADAISASGMLDATHLAYRNDRPTGETLTIRDAHFNFTLPLQASAATPSPTLTLPPVYVKA